MPELPRINWGDATTWDDVRPAAGGPPPDPGLVWAWEPGFDWAKFWNGVLWFGEPPDKLYRDVRGVANDYIGAPVRRLGDDIAADVGGGLADVGAGLADLGDLGGDAARKAWATAAPWVVVGAGVLLVYSVARAR